MSSLDARHRFTISNGAANEKETIDICSEAAQDIGAMIFGDYEEHEKALSSEVDQFSGMMTPGDEEKEKALNPESKHCRRTSSNAAEHAAEKRKRQKKVPMPNVISKIFSVLSKNQNDATR